MYGAESSEIYLDRVTKVEKMDRDHGEGWLQ